MECTPVTGRVRGSKLLDKPASNETKGKNTMKTTTILLLACSPLLAMSGCAHKNHNTVPAQEATPVVGGLTDADVHDNDATTAAQYAVNVMARESKANLVVVAILNAKRQVIAGLNYRLTLHVAGVEGGKSRIARAVVWKKLDGSHELTKRT